MNRFWPFAWIIPAGFFAIYMLAADLPIANGRADCIAKLGSAATPSACFGNTQYESRRPTRDAALR